MLAVCLALCLEPTVIRLTALMRACRDIVEAIGQLFAFEMLEDYFAIRQLCWEVVNYFESLYETETE